MNPHTRLVADRYRLDRQVGTGAMGVVWRAHDERLDRTVALKELVMQPGLTETAAETARARAMREGRIAARLQHPHAICVYDVALDPGTGTSGQVVPWLVMEYLPSHSLATILAEQGPLAPHEVARIGWQVAAALTTAHQSGIVHRDIKPGNVLLSQDGTAKITDFGISRASWDATVTGTGVLAGTPAYFAPEVARGEQPGPASDVFSLGSMLYVAVEGEPPFGLDDNALALLRTVAEGQVRPPRRAGPLAPILMQLLADDPAARPSMADAAAALGAVAARGPSAATAPPLFTSPTVRASRPPTAAAPEATPTAVGLPAGPRKRAHRVVTWQQRARPAALFGTAACLAGVAVVLAVMGSKPTAGQDQLAAARSAAPAMRSPQPAPVPQVVQPPPAQPMPAQLEQTVRNYYGLLPEDSAVAWQYLGTAEQAQGFEHYTHFWNGINRISIRGPVAVQGNSVLVNLVFEPTNRKPTVERYRLNMTTSPIGRVLIESAARITR
ncbi:MAG TPA: serine/threonine-protein kinase [Pseudonocardiaceae bacterium]|nr:serine/threonine-protein kinase [Pseudonocardiaceae bacterium]